MVGYSRAGLLLGVLCLGLVALKTWCLISMLGRPLDYGFTLYRSNTPNDCILSRSRLGQYRVY